VASTDINNTHQADDAALASELTLERILEAVVSASDAPVSVSRLLNLFPEQARPESQQIIAALETLAKQYQSSALELVKVSSGYRFQTRAAYAQWINKLFETRPPRLSRALLETLAIIAYQQPVTRGDIQEVRGVAVSSDMMQKLIERDWVKKIGEREVPGRPSLFATTPEFLNYFNLSSLKDLPELNEPRELEDIAREMAKAGVESDPAKMGPDSQAKIQTSFEQMSNEGNHEHDPTLKR